MKLIKLLLLWGIIAVNCLAVEIVNPSDYPDPFSPGNDGIKDEITIEFTSSKNWAQWTIEIQDKVSDEIYKSFSGLINDNNLKVSVLWDGADEFGNYLEDGTYDYTIVLLSDIVPPVTSISSPFYSDGNDAYVALDEPVILSAQDLGIPVSGVKEILYFIDQDAPLLYSIPISFPIDGEYTLSYYSIDNADNIETEKQVPLFVDGTAPQSDISIGNPQYVLPDHSLVVSSETPIELNGNDIEKLGVESGLQKLQYRLGLQGLWEDYFDIFTISADDGQNTLFFRAVDHVGNQELENSISLILDSSGPVVEVFSPVEFGLINGVISIIGTITDPHFDQYSIAYSGEYGSGIILENETAPVENDVIATWDTGFLIPGNYQITITASDHLGNSTTQNIPVIIGQPEFLFSFGENKLNKPMYITESPDGTLYVTDENNKRIRMYDSEGMPKGSFAINVSQPQGVYCDDIGDIYVSGHKDLTKYAPNGDQLWKVNGLNQPAGIRVNRGEVFVADRNNDRIAVFTEDGSFLREIKAGFNKPMDLDFDSQDNMYVVDSENCRVVMFDPAEYEFGSFASCCIGQAHLNKPEGIFVTEQNNYLQIFVTDRNNGTVKVFDQYGLQINSFGVHGSGEGEFINPEGILMDQDGRIFVVDRNNDRVQVFGMPEIETDLVETPVIEPGHTIEINNIVSYPSPFSPDGDGVNDNGHIRYELSEDAYVQIKVYDQIGKLVFVFDKLDSGFNGGKTGVNDIIWEGVNNSGRTVNNGVYIYHIRAKGVSGKSSTASGTIVILK